MTANDLRDLLRQAAAEGTDTVELAEDAVVARIRHRRTRDRRLAAGGAVLASVAVVAATSWATRPNAVEPPAATTPTTPRIVTSNSAAPSGLEALFRTTLRVAENGCVQAGSEQSVVTVVWPRGYTVRGDSKSFEILDPAKKVVAGSAQRVELGGGAADQIEHTWTNTDCATGRQLWLAGTTR